MKKENAKGITKLSQYNVTMAIIDEYQQTN